MLTDKLFKAYPSIADRMGMWLGLEGKDIGDVDEDGVVDYGNYKWLTVNLPYGLYSSQRWKSTPDSPCVVVKHRCYPAGDPALGEFDPLCAFWWHSQPCGNITFVVSGEPVTYNGFGCEIPT